MKALLWFAVMGLWIGSAGISLAQNTSPNGTSPGFRRMMKVGPIARQLQERLHAQYKLAKEGQNSGKLTSTQVKTIILLLKSVRQQEVTFIKQNGTSDLTADQAAQLDQTLDQNSSVLGEPSATPSAH